MRRRRSPSTRASAISCASPAIIELIASFTIRAWFPSPTWWTVGPIRRLDGLDALERLRCTRDDEGQVPRSHDRRVAADGCAEYSTAAASASDATRADTPGETVLTSTRTLPGAEVDDVRRNGFQRVVVGEQGDHVDLRGQVAGCRGDAGTRASRPAAFSRVRFVTRRGYPASRRRSAIAVPMLPRPINPTMRRGS